MALKNLYDAKIVQLHILGQAATGDLARPFKAPAMFGVQTGPSTDPAEIKNLEQAPKLSKKDE